jgi:hypothetical protein
LTDVLAVEPSDLGHSDSVRNVAYHPLRSKANTGGRTADFAWGARAESAGARGSHL